MKIQKTIKAKIIGLTNIKEQKLKQEYENFQDAIKLYNKDLDFLEMFNDIKLYSATKQQAERLTKRNLKKEQSIIIRRDLIKIQKQDTKLSKYWARIPCYQRRGGIWVAIQFPHNQECLLSCSIRESKLIRKSNKWFLLITVQKEIHLKESYSNVLAVDLGERVMATVCGSFDNSIRFYGREIRGIRRHYSWLRKRLGERKLLKKIKELGQVEQRKVNDVLHKISREIVDKAKETDSAIVLGELKGIRKSAKGKRFNRIISNMPYYKLTKYIEYKANWEGIKVIKIDEQGTSHTCSRCGSQGKRINQAIFNCSACRLKDYNADLNGALNILKRFSGQVLENGVVLAQPLTQQHKLVENLSV